MGGRGTRSRPRRKQPERPPIPPKAEIGMGGERYATVRSVWLNGSISFTPQPQDIVAVVSSEVDPVSQREWVLVRMSSSPPGLRVATST